MKKFLTAVTVFFCTVCVLNQPVYSQYKTDKKLEHQLKTLLDSFHGTAGVYTRNLKTGKEVAINADTIFPTASIVKVPILIEFSKRFNKGTTLIISRWFIAIRWHMEDQALCNFSRIAQKRI